MLIHSGRDKCIMAYSCNETLYNNEIEWIPRMKLMNNDGNRSQTQKSMQSKNSTYMKFKKRQNQSVVIEVRLVVSPGEGIID